MADAALPVVQACQSALDVAADWLQHTNRPKRMSRASEDGLQQAITGLENALDEFQQGRLQILLPFRHLFDPNHPAVDLTYKARPYRALEWCCSLQSDELPWLVSEFRGRISRRESVVRDRSLISRWNLRTPFWPFW